mmetsp:Transcript_44048/g.139821  ORF Transcript_44048/g.139821 Transcript_44048/m.139821 type:complete len:283 (-) Transcript_44048:105-953(-)
MKRGPMSHHVPRQGRVRVRSHSGEKCMQDNRHDLLDSTFLVFYLVREMFVVYVAELHSETVPKVMRRDSCGSDIVDAHTLNQHLHIVGIFFVFLLVLFWSRFLHLLFWCFFSTWRTVSNQAVNCFCKLVGSTGLLQKSMTNLMLLVQMSFQMSTSKLMWSTDNKQSLLHCSWSTSMTSPGFSTCSPLILILPSRRLTPTLCTSMSVPIAARSTDSTANLMAMPSARADERKQATTATRRATMTILVHCKGFLDQQRRQHATQRLRCGPLSSSASSQRAKIAL